MSRPGWHRPDPTDAYFAYDMEHVLFGLDLPSLDALRRGVAAMAQVNPGIFRVTESASGRWRAFSRPELRDAPERLVTSSDAIGPEGAMGTVLATTLRGVNFRLLHGPDWLGLRVSHAALFDGVSTFTMLAGLLSPGVAPQSVQVVPGPRRDAMLAGYLATHPVAVRAAAVHRARLASTRLAPAPATPVEPPAFTHVHSSGQLPRRLRELRDECWPTASVGAVLLVGFRAGLAQAGVTPHAGAEVLMDVRRYFPSPRPIFGNWAAGVHVRAVDDYSPTSVTRATQAAARAGLPVAAMAAGRVLGRLRASTTLDRPVPSPMGAPRISFTFLGAHSVAARLPWRTDRTAFTVERTRPANAEAITLVAKEIGGRFSFTASHYESVWPAAVVRAALTRFLDDPLQVIRSAADRSASLPEAS